ncbi:hypothetical protein [Mycobacteroides abscessus]|uniref:hypothetical protein n=1 Tax=Mycobacteroides abscessus TaxID=36809 RepID=UPI00130000E4|nr:hypothetical protein [Mycobacteroides abscessus]
MAAVQPGERYSAPAAADLSTKRYHLVKFDDNQNIVLATAATDAILGVLDNSPKLGQTADVVLVNGSGSFKVKLGANTSARAYLTANGDGEAIGTTTTGNRVIGRLVRTGVENEIAEYIKHNEKY